MTKKILYCATVDYHFKAFHLPYMKWFKDQGWQVHVAALGNIDLPYTDTKYNIPIQRSPFKLQNRRAYKQLKQIIEDNHYDIIHCHTPLGGALARLAARQKRKQGTKVLYTAHGFHFCKGAPMMNWLIYYPVEKYLARHTDNLITINMEDYRLARKHRFKAGKIVQVHGVGIDTERFKPISEKNRNALKKSFGYQADDFLLFYAAEFNKNKNQQFLIHVLTLIKQQVPNARLLLAGEGPLLESCRKLAQTHDVLHMVDFLGFRNDIARLVPMCDLAVSASFREGLPVNIMEAMACGLPIVAIENRGHCELVDNGQNGWTLASTDVAGFANKVAMLANHEETRKRLGNNNRKAIEATYSTGKVLAEKAEIYQCYMNEQKQEGALWAIQ